MRSSLFQRNARKSSQGAQAHSPSHHDSPNAHILVFQLPADADALRCPFSFEATTSLNLCEYGKPNKKYWPKDVLAIVHNAIRSELLDLTVILKALQRLGNRLIIADFLTLRPWLYVCTAIILDFLDMEARVILPWFAAAFGYGKSDDNANKLFTDLPKRQAAIREIILNSSCALSEMCEVPTKSSPANLKSGVGLEGLTTAQRTLLLLGSLDALVSETCDYLEDQEKLFPTGLATVYKCEKKDGKNVWNAIIKDYATSARKPECALPLLVRWLTDVKAAKTLTKTLAEFHKYNYANMLSQFEIHHGGFAQRLKARVENGESK